MRTVLSSGSRSGEAGRTRLRGLRPLRASGLQLLTCLTVGLSLSTSACQDADTAHVEADHEGHPSHPIVVTSPTVQEVTETARFVCQIHSRRHVEVRALERGYLESVKVREGQAVKKGQLLFKLLPVVYKSKLAADQAELLAAEIALRNAETLFEQNIVSDQELALARAEQNKAKAKVDLAEAELSFTEIRAPFDGLVDRQYEQQGSLTEEGDMLTVISDNEVMWVYFNVPEADYLEFRALPGAFKPEAPERLVLLDTRIELQLANGRPFDQDAGDTLTVESTFDSETGNIKFRADFPNPDNLLRHGQTGTILIHRRRPGAVVIPQRATFEILDKRYVYVVDEDDVVRQRRIEIAHETDDLFVVAAGLEANQKIVLEGVRQVRDGQHVKAEFRDPASVLSNLKQHAE